MPLGGAPETEAAYREAIAAGVTVAWNDLGNLLAGQPGREDEAEAAYRGAIDSDTTGQALEAAARNLGYLLVRRGDVASARAAYEAFVRARLERCGVDMADAHIARMARFLTAVRRAVRRRR